MTWVPGPSRSVTGRFHNSHCTTEPIGHDRPDLASFFAAPTSILAAPGASWRRLYGPSSSNLDGQTSKTTNSAAEGYQNHESRTFAEMSSKSRSRYHGKSIQRAKNDAQGAHLVPEGSQRTPQSAARATQNRSKIKTCGAKVNKMST